MKYIFTALLAGIFLLYPFAVYLGLHYFSPIYIALFLLVLLIGRLSLLRNQLTKMPWLLPASLLGASAILFSIFFNDTLGFKLYPLAVNIAMFIVFAYSYINPPSVIESLARLTEKNFPPQAVSYTHKVTLIWCVFFIINGSISLYTALAMSLKTWTFYNGFLSYVFMGILMAAEYIVRLKVKKSHQHFSQDNTTND